MLLTLFSALFVYGYIVTPALTVYSWVRWSRSQRRRSRRVRVSLTGLALATAALALGIVTVAVSSIHHGVFLYLAPERKAVYVLGLVLSCVATVVSFLGVFEDNPIRLKSLLVALGTLSFWFLAGSGR